MKPTHVQGAAQRFAARAGLACLTLLFTLSAAGCPPCPSGFHQVVETLGDGTYDFTSPTAPGLMVDSGHDVTTNVSYAFVVNGRFTLPDGRSAEANGIPDVAAGEGAPSPGLPLGALLAHVAGTDYYVGAKISTPFQQPGRLMFRLNLPPDPPFTGTGPRPPNAVTTDLHISWRSSRTSCVKDGEEPVPQPEPEPQPAVTWSTVYTTYFAAGTIGKCQNCHAGPATATRPYFGTSADEMYTGLQNAALLNGGGAARLGDGATSPLIWCNPNGTMPRGALTPNDEACKAVRSWLAAGAQKN